MKVPLSDCPYSYLDEFFCVVPRYLVETQRRPKRQMIDEMPTRLAKKLTLELQS
jgi:hypothetical protein